MIIFDVHTHHSNEFSFSESDCSFIEIVQDVNSIGIHPWALDDMNDEEVETVMHNLFAQIETDEYKQIKAVGECGIDKLCTTDLEKQKDVFTQHVLLSEQFSLPVIVHCVKGIDELLRIKKELSPKQPWIWHGFRGKPQQLVQLIQAGFYISFGLKYNKESLLACPINKMLLETDDESISIKNIYAQVSSNLCINKKELATNIAANCQLIFQHH